MSKVYTDQNVHSAIASLGSYLIDFLDFLAARADNKKLAIGPVTTIKQLIDFVTGQPDSAAQQVLDVFTLWLQDPGPIWMGYPTPHQYKDLVFPTDRVVFNGKPEKKYAVEWIPPGEQFKLLLAPLPQEPQLRRRIKDWDGGKRSIRIHPLENP